MGRAGVRKNARSKSRKTEEQKESDIAVGAYRLRRVYRRDSYPYAAADKPQRDFAGGRQRKTPAAAGSKVPA